MVCPWNLPLLLMTWKVGPALACGNTVIVKPSEETPQTATLLGEVMNTVGVPKGVYNVVHGFGPDSAGEFLTTHPDVDAHHLHRRDAHRRGHHEGRGRRSAAGVARDGRQERRRSSLPTAISTPRSKARMRSVFANCGQVCLGTERVYVERPIFDKFVAGDEARRREP